MNGKKSPLCMSFDSLIRIIFIINIFFVHCLVAQRLSSCEDTLNTVINHAHGQTGITKFYDPSYVKIEYPGGDIPLERGVCTDVIIRAFRAVGVDLQKLIHQDMKNNFELYPKKWGLKRADSNIDHRRVPNIVTFFKRQDKAISISDKGFDYKPGDIVTWDLGDRVDHIGIVSDVMIEGTDRYRIIHNIGRGTELEDMLFEYTITGHFRYFCFSK